MTPYGQLYNERFTKEAPRYNQGAQARTYHDYMRNIQAQKQAAGQTFGNLYNQQQTQSFYDRAMGQPQGLSGGLATQYNAARSAQSAAQSGQIAQQRYQAFADISAQEAQAGQYAQAQRLQQQQVEMGQMQLEQQRFAQAQQIMAAPNLSEEQKQDQLTRLGMTEGQISRMNAPTAAPVIGGATTLATAAAVPAVIGKVQTYRGAKDLLGRVNTSADIAPLQEVIKTEKGRLADLQNTFNKAQSAVDKAGDAATSAQKKALQKSKNELSKAKYTIKKTQEEIVTKQNTILDDIIGSSKKGGQATTTVGKEIAEDLATEGVKKGKVKNFATLAKKGGKSGKVFGKAFGTVGKVAGSVLGAYFILDSILMVTTGTGVMGQVKSLIEQGEFAADGGIIGLANQ